MESVSSFRITNTKYIHKNLPELLNIVTFLQHKSSIKKNNLDALIILPIVVLTERERKHNGELSFKTIEKNKYQ